MSKRRKRRIGSVKTELLKKSREAALSAVQIFNNPNIQFKSETFIVLVIIAWTYLLHAYYRDKSVEYRYHRLTESGARRFDKTKRGAYKYWELERCLNCGESPIDNDAANNLRFLIGLRHEIEHQMTTQIDSYLSARFQACCLNFNEYIKKLFGDKYGIDRHLAFSLQFSAIDEEQRATLEGISDLPAHIKSYISGFDENLSETEFNNPKFAYRILFVPKAANRKGQADKVVEYVKPDSELAKEVNREYMVFKDREKIKFRPGNIVSKMQEEGFPNFNMHHHTQLWKSSDARKPGKGLGTNVEGQWYWYETWVEVVLEHCKNNREQYI